MDQLWFNSPDENILSFGKTIHTIYSLSNADSWIHTINSLSNADSWIKCTNNHSLHANHRVPRFLGLLWDVLLFVGKRKEKSGETARKGSKEALPRATEELPRDTTEKILLVLNIE